MLKLKFKKFTADAIIPTQAHNGDMFDLYANADVEINSYRPTIVPLGIAFDIPDGYRIKVFGRSSLSLKKGIIVSNSTAIIDTGYKNEIGLICHSLPLLATDSCKEIISKEQYDRGYLYNNIVQIKKGDKLAQFQLEKIEEFELEEVSELDMTNDRQGGFGSTGDKK